MKIKKTFMTNKAALIIGLLLVISVVGLASYYALNQSESPTSADSNGIASTDEAIGNKPDSTNTNAKGNNVDPASQPGSTPVPEPTPPTQPGNKSTVGMEITAANQNGSIVTIRTLIETITSAGTCKLTIKAADSGKVYQASASVQAQPSSSTCKGFSVPVDALGTGEWSIAVTYESDDLMAISSRSIDTR